MHGLVFTQRNRTGIVRTPESPGGLAERHVKSQTSLLSPFPREIPDTIAYFLRRQSNRDSVVANLLHPQPLACTEDNSFCCCLQAFSLIVHIWKPFQVEWGLGVFQLRADRSGQIHLHSRVWTYLLFVKFQHLGPVFPDHRCPLSRGRN